MNEIFSRIKVSGRQVATVVAFVVVASVAQMAIPSMLGAMIDKGVGEGRAGLVAGIAVAMVVLSVVACAVNIAAARLAASVTTKFSADLRAELFHKVQTFSAAEIDKFGTASLITRNTTDVTTIQTFATQLLGLGLHLNEGLRRQLLGQEPEEQRKLGLREIIEDRRDVRGVHGDEDIPEGGVFLALCQGRPSLLQRDHRAF